MACTRTPNPWKDKVQFFGGVLIKYAPVAQLHQSTAFLQRLLQVGILSGVQKNLQLFVTFINFVRIKKQMANSLESDVQS